MAIEVASVSVGVFFVGYALLVEACGLGPFFLVLAMVSPATQTQAWFSGSHPRCGCYPRTPVCVCVCVRVEVGLSTVQLQPHWNPRRAMAGPPWGRRQSPWAPPWLLLGRSVPHGGPHELHGSFLRQMCGRRMPHGPLDSARGPLGPGPYLSMFYARAL